jgi:CubicO group peptidase (beta-lactamase class C family)
MKTLLKTWILFTSSLIVLSCSTATYSGRWVRWNASSIDDYKKFPAHEFGASEEAYLFIDAMRDLDGMKIPIDPIKSGNLLEVLNESKTTAFLIIRNDSVLYEKYLNGYSKESMNTTFSVAKSITSLMVGRAIDEGLIKNSEASVVEYLPELLSVDSLYKDLKLSHLLDMKSGVQFKDHDLIWGDKPKAYYHPELRDRIMELPITDVPGTKFQYNSYNPIIVGMILEKVCGTSPAVYFEKQLWNKMGMEFGGSWSMDSELSGMTKMESGLNLRARDFAKFGRLVLNKGKLDGESLVSAEWLDQIFQVDEDHIVAGYNGEIYYKNYWWIYSENGKEADIISGWGHLGQYLYIFPKSNVIIVRMGKDNDGVKSWGDVFKSIDNQLNK